jgi:hypothetical protein
VEAHLLNGPTGETTVVGRGIVILAGAVRNEVFFDRTALVGVKSREGSVRRSRVGR